jgi:hypothetical protein
VRHAASGGTITKQRRDSALAASKGERAAMTCDAQAYGEHYVMCDRCGLAWHVDQAKPDCAPVTFKRMVEAIELEAESHEASHTTIAELQQAGMPADPQPALARAARLRCVARLVRKVAGSEAIHRILRAAAAS